MNMIDEATSKTIPFSSQAQVFKLLNHPGRIAILNILRDGEHCVCHMEAFLGYRQSYISQQLSILREAGVIQDRRDGWNIFYRVVTSEIYQLLDAASVLSGNQEMEGNAKIVNCECPHCKP